MEPEAQREQQYQDSGKSQECDAARRGHHTPRGAEAVRGDSGNSEMVAAVKQSNADYAS
jgi:hypothetical protein